MPSPSHLQRWLCFCMQIVAERRGNSNVNFMPTHNKNVRQGMGKCSSILSPLPSLLRSLCVCVSVCAPEILGMPHWSSLADLLPQSLAKGFMLTAHGGTFNWNKSSASPERRKNPRNLPICCHVPLLPRPLAHYTHTDTHEAPDAGRGISHWGPKALSILEPFYSSFTASLRLISHGFSHFPWILPS